MAIHNDLCDEGRCRCEYNYCSRRVLTLLYPHTMASDIALLRATLRKQNNINILIVSFIIRFLLACRCTFVHLCRQYIKCLCHMKLHTARKTKKKIICKQLISSDQASGAASPVFPQDNSLQCAHDIYFFSDKVITINKNTTEDDFGFVVKTNDHIIPKQ